MFFKGIHVCEFYEGLESMKQMDLPFTAVKNTGVRALSRNTSGVSTK